MEARKNSSPTPSNFCCGKRVAAVLLEEQRLKALDITGKRCPGYCTLRYNLGFSLGNLGSQAFPLLQRYVQLLRRIGEKRLLFVECRHRLTRTMGAQPLDNVQVRRRKCAFQLFGCARCSKKQENASTSAETCAHPTLRTNSPANQNSQVHEPARTSVPARPRPEPSFSKKIIHIRTL